MLLTFDGTRVIGAGQEDKWDDIYYACWLEMIYQGMRGLIYYDEDKKMWG